MFSILNVKRVYFKNFTRATQRGLARLNSGKNTVLVQSKAVHDRQAGHAFECLTHDACATVMMKSMIVIQDLAYMY